MGAYIELEVTSNFTFLEGASHPGELVEQAKALGYEAVGISDKNTLAGVVRAHIAAKEHGIRLLVGCRLEFVDHTPTLLCYPQTRAAYGALSQMLTEGKRRSIKGQCTLDEADLALLHPESILIALAPPELDARFKQELTHLKQRLGLALYLSGRFLFDVRAAKRLEEIARLAAELGIAMVATNDVHAHTPQRRVLQDVLTCIREHCSIDEAGYKLKANAERYLKPIEEIERLFARYPEAIANTKRIAKRIAFSLDELKYEYPDTPVPPGKDAQQHLSDLAYEGASARFPKGVPEKMQKLIDYELDIIGKLRYAPYFLTVHDIVRFARAQGILCQGRGSAANSAVCYFLGVTSVDPEQIDVFFERFISLERNEPPDIDVDFEHERREEVMQYIYQRYGRDKAGIAATVITYRKRSALRDVGKALGVPLEQIEALLVALKGYRLSETTPEILGAAGFAPEHPRIQLLLEITAELLSFPRHLSQHVGGFVITRGPLTELVPIGNAAMPDRTFIEWDKDDLDAMGMLKIDVLSLGMLTCIRRCFDLLKQHYQRPLTLATVPTEDPKVYDMLCRGDAIGVFQVESRAQMSMLPRLKPRKFYDLVIEVAIVRPGPIQGGMVHPYLRRRNGEEKVTYPSKELEAVLSKTLGVPLFQEQAMRIAVVAAGFTPSESDKLRRAMATFRHSGVVHRFREPFVLGMLKKGYELEFAERCFQQILGFGEYGFPESHAASFSLLVYVSAWLKHYYPAVFACALLNSLPMGFYAPAQIIDDAKRHGVKVLPVDVNHSAWENTLQQTPQSLALRLGLCNIKGLAHREAQWIVACRGKGYDSPEHTGKRSGVSKTTLDRLANADAFASMTIKRREALWLTRGVEPQSLPLFDALTETETQVTLPDMSELEEVTADYHTLTFSLRAHPVSFLRERLTRMGHVQHEKLKNLPTKSKVKISGLVVIRQRPPTAKGVIFQTIEDESGFANVVIWPHVFEQHRDEALACPYVGVEGIVERQGEVIHVIAKRLVDLSHLLQNLESHSRDFH